VRPKRWVVREWFVDPTGNGPDEEQDRTWPTKAEAIARAEVLYEAGRSVGVFERLNIRKPPGIEDEIPWYAYDWDEREVWTMPDLPELRPPGGTPQRPLKSRRRS
jgi:hypothetical protein